MKKAIIFCFAIGLLALNACNKDEETVEFEFTQEYEFTMSTDSISIDTTIALTSTDIKSQLKEYSEANSSLVSLVQEIELVSINLESTDPSSQELNFIENIDVFMNSGTLSELMVASKNPVPTTTGNTLDLDVEQDVGVLQYLKNTNFKFRISLNQRSALPQETKVKVTGSFKVVAGVDK